MDDSKIFMFPDGGTRQTSNDVNSLLPLLMCNGGFGGGNWIWIIFLFFLYPLMRNGGLFGNMGQNCGSCLGPLANMVNNNDGIAFNRWYADMCRKGIQVDWYNCR